MSEPVLLSPKSLKELNLKPSQATLQYVIYLLKTPASQRSHKQISILQALTRKIKFFIQKIEDLGESVHFDSCKSMNYEFFEAEQVIYT